jgi:hypothetical protein
MSAGDVYRGETMRRLSVAGGANSLKINRLRVATAGPPAGPHLPGARLPGCRGAQLPAAWLSRYFEMPAAAAIELIAFRCARTVGRVFVANALASGSCPDAISFWNRSMVS